MKKGRASDAAFKRAMGKGVKALADLVAAKKATDIAIKGLKERLELVEQSRNAEWAKMLKLYQIRVKMNKLA